MMSTITLSSPKAPASVATATSRKGILARLYNAIVAAQTARAERELALYIQRTGDDPRR